MIIVKLKAILGLLLAFILSDADGLRFSHFPITVNTDLLIIGRPSTLTCNYVKYRTETVREITWFAGYNGMKMKIFHLNVGTNKRDSTSYEFVRTDASSATENSLDVTLPEFRNKDIKFSCEVEVQRDSGYGNIRHIKKMGETDIPVADTHNHKLILKPGSNQASLRELAQKRVVNVGQSLTISCSSIGATPSPNLTLFINGEPLDRMYGGSVDELPYNENMKELVVTGYLDTVKDDDFVGDVLIAECKAKFNDFLLEKKQLALKKGSENDREEREPRGWNYNDNPHYEYQHGRRQGYNQQGHHGNNRRHQQGDNHDIQNRLMEMLDPSRHVHPGIAYDFYTGYIVVIADHLTHAESSDYYGSKYTTVIGQLPHKVKTALEQNYGKYEHVEEHTVKMKMPPVDVLNILGNLGYRVISTTSPETNKTIWTLEHRNFEELQSSPNDL